MKKKQTTDVDREVFVASDGTIVPVAWGSGNVFCDMGYPDADLAKYKSRLAGKIAEAIERRGLTQKQAAATLGVDQPRVSHLVRGQLAGFSSDTLLAFLKKLDYEVTIAIHDRRAAVDEQESIAV